MALNSGIVALLQFSPLLRRRSATGCARGFDTKFIALNRVATLERGMVALVTERMHQ